MSENLMLHFIAWCFVSSLAAFDAVEFHCSADVDSSSSHLGNKALLQVSWRSGSQQVVPDIASGATAHPTMTMLDTDARADEILTDFNYVCDCLSGGRASNYASLIQLSPHCGECYQPNGRSECVVMTDPSTPCAGCKVDKDSFHCPGHWKDECLGHVCFGEGSTKVRKPPSRSCDSLRPSAAPVPKQRIFEGWYDIQGSGRCQDWCYWEGCDGHGPDPTKHVIHVGDSGCLAFWKCKPNDSSARATGCGHFQATELPIFNFPRCDAKGMLAPPLVELNPYIPGAAGAAWTVEEILIVRAKVRELFARGHDLMIEAGINGSNIQEEWWSWPDAAKVLRLGFHDCFKYTDGTGGCDGCLNWQGVGHRFPRDSLGRGRHKRAGDGHNNGLKFTVEVLEKIYRDRGFPQGTLLLPVSLKESGKSRADLWAFAAMDAVEYSIEKNNRVCRDPELFGPDQCHPRAGAQDCIAVMQRPFQFKTGRRDCSSDFKTYKKEVSPSAEGNGQATVNFFKENFNFKNGEDVVAIMGAHTLGRPHVTHSLFRYVWKAYSGSLFNNGYFRNLAMKEDWFMSSEKAKTCADRRVGNATGNRPIARWLAHARGDTDKGGPVEWIQQKLVCPNCRLRKHSDEACCTQGVPKDGECHPDCQKWRFVNGMDEIALPCEMGLVYDFQVDANGMPSGCPGFADFNMNKWGGWLHHGKGPGLKNYDMTWTRVDGKRSGPQCPLNSKKVGSSPPLYQIVEAFANDQAQFIKSFMHALELMLENGYGQKDNELKLAPKAGMQNFACRKKEQTGVYSCVSK